PKAANGRAPAPQGGGPAVHATVSALRVLRRLAGLLQTVLLALDDAGVSGEEPSLLQWRAVPRVQLAQGPGDGQAQGTGLPTGAATAQVGVDVHRVDPLGDRQRILDLLLVHLAGEVVLQRPAVADDVAAAGHQTHPDD